MAEAFLKRGRFELRSRRWERAGYYSLIQMTQHASVKAWGGKGLLQLRIGRSPAQLEHSAGLEVLEVLEEAGRCAGAITQRLVSQF